MDIGKLVFNATWARLPYARATLLTDQGESVACLCVNIGLTNSTGDYGVSLSPAANIRLPENALPESLKQGSQITLTRHNGQEYVLRVGEIRRSTGLATVTVEAING
jgi:hypothetical protein